MSEPIDTHELRDLRWRNRQLGKQLGKAGAKIYELHCQLAEAREITGKIERNHVRGLERQQANDSLTIVDLRIALERQRDIIVELRQANTVLTQRLEASDQHPVVTDARA